MIKNIFTAKKIIYVFFNNLGLMREKVEFERI